MLFSSARPRITKRFEEHLQFGFELRKVSASLSSPYRSTFRVPKTCGTYCELRSGLLSNKR